MCSEVISKTHKANRTYFEHKLALISAIISLSQCMSDSCCDACFTWRCSIINVNDLSGVMMAGDNFVPLKTTCDSWLISEMFTVQINLLQMEPGVDTTLRCRPRGWTQSRQINKKFKQLSRERQPVVSAGISFSSFFSSFTALLPSFSNKTAKNKNPQNSARQSGLYTQKRCVVDNLW